MLAPNQFSHLTDDEFAKGYLGVAASAPDLSAGTSGAIDGSPREVVDWVEAGKVTAVKSQESVSATSTELPGRQQMLQGGMAVMQLTSHSCQGPC